MSKDEVEDCRRLFKKRRFLAKLERRDYFDQKRQVVAFLIAVLQLKMAFSLPTPPISRPYKVRQSTTSDSFSSWKKSGLFVEEAGKLQLSFGLSFEEDIEEASRCIHFVKKTWALSKTRLQVAYLNPEEFESNWIELEKKCAEVMTRSSRYVSQSTKVDLTKHDVDNYEKVIGSATDESRLLYKLVENRHKHSSGTRIYDIEETEQQMGRDGRVEPLTIMGIIAIVGIITSIITSAVAIDKSLGNEEKIENLTVNLKSSQQDKQRLEKEVNDLIKKAARTDAHTQYQEEYLKVKNYVETLLSEVKSREAFIMKVHQDGVLDLTLLPGSALDALFNSSQEVLKSKNVSLAAQTAIDLQNLPIQFSMLPTIGEFQFTLQIPLIDISQKEQSTFRLFKIHQTPFQLWDQFITFESDQEYIATREDANYFYLLKQAELEKCTKMRGIFFCSNVVKRSNSSAHSSCLSSIFTKNIEGIRKTCALKQAPMRLDILPISTSEAYIVSPDVTTTSIKCDGAKDVYDEYLSGITRIHMDPGCALTLNGTLGWSTSKSLEHNVGNRIFDNLTSSQVIGEKLARVKDRNAEFKNLLGRNLKTMQGSALTMSLLENANPTNFLLQKFWEEYQTTIIIGILILIIVIIALVYCCKSQEPRVVQMRSYACKVIQRE